MPDIDLAKYYTVQEAADRLSLNSGKKVGDAYVRQLVAKGKISSVRINSRFSVYPRWEINEYIVEGRGEKLSRAQRARRERAQRKAEPELVA